MLSKAGSILEDDDAEVDDEKAHDGSKNFADGGIEMFLRHG